MILNLNLVNKSEFNNYQNRFNDLTIFNSYEWISFLSFQYNYNVNYIHSSSGESGFCFFDLKNIVGKRKIVSIPFSDYYRLAFHDENDIPGILSELIHYAGSDEIQIRTSINKISKSFQEVNEAVIHELTLDDSYINLSKNFRPAIIRGINKGINCHLISRISQNYNDIDTFYKLHLMTRKRQGMPVQPKKFFINLHKFLIESEKGFLIVVEKDKIPLAIGIFLGFNNTLTYKYGASNHGYLNIRPNNLLFSVAIQEAIDRGYKIFDFGKTDNWNEGLRRFKSSWGAKETSLYYSYYPKLRKRGVMNRLKDNVVSPVIKNSPKIVSRIIGETMYKYFG